MPTRQHVFPLDLTMKLSSNHIVNEVKQFTSPADRLFVPNAGPFYTESMVIKTSSGRLLQPITEYKLLYMNEDATIASNRNVCAVIQILNESLNEVHLDYRVIGGEYGDTVYGILQELDKAGPIVKQIDWKTNVYNKPTEYPPAPHFHRADDFSDWDKVWVELEGIRKAIIVGDEQSWAAVFRYFNRRIEFMEGNISNSVINNVNGILGGFVTHTDLNNYYTKADINRLLEESDVKLSNDAGNLLELREDGLYYGIQAPPDLTNLYVDAVNGSDTNPGSKAEPLKTLDKALLMVAPNMSNTIHLKIIPEENKHTHSYFISKVYKVTQGATRNIFVYGHPLIDGEQNKAARKLDPNNYWYNTSTVPQVPIWVRWMDISLSDGRTVQEPAKFMLTDGVLGLYKVNIIASRPENTDAKPVNGYSYKSVFGGSGKLILRSSRLTRVTNTEENKDNPDVRLRPAFNDALTNAAYWIMSHGGLLNLDLQALVFDYATIVNKVSPNENGHMQYGIVNSHGVYENAGFGQVGASGFKGVPFLELYTSSMSIYIAGVTSWNGEAKVLGIPAVQLPNNTYQWLSDNLTIGRISWSNGIPTNLSANFPIGKFNIANNSNAYKVVTVTANMIPNETRGLLDILMWRDGLSNVEFDRLISGMSYHRITSDRLKVLNIDMEGGGVLGEFVPTGLQVTLYNATASEITVNQTLNGKNFKRIWLPYSAMTLIFINKTDIDIIGGMVEE